MNESQLQSFYDYPIYPTDYKTYSDTGFVNIDNGSQGGTHWTCFIIKNSESFYFDSFGGRPNKILLNQLPEPKLYHNYKTEEKISKLCASYCLYFLFLIERRNIKMLYSKCFLKICERIIPIIYFQYKKLFVQL